MVRCVNLKCAHPRVPGDFRFVFETDMLAFAGGYDAFADFCRGFARAVARNFAEFHRRHFDVQINAVEQRAGNTSKIILNLARELFDSPGVLPSGVRDVASLRPGCDRALEEHFARVES